MDRFLVYLIQNSELNEYFNFFNSNFGILRDEIWPVETSISIPTPVWHSLATYQQSIVYNSYKMYMKAKF